MRLYVIAADISGANQILLDSIKEIIRGTAVCRIARAQWPLARYVKMSLVDPDLKLVLVQTALSGGRPEVIELLALWNAPRAEFQ